MGFETYHAKHSVNTALVLYDHSLPVNMQKYATQYQLESDADHQRNSQNICTRCQREHSNRCL